MPLVALVASKHAVMPPSIGGPAAEKDTPETVTISYLELMCYLPSWSHARFASNKPVDYSGDCPDERRIS